MSEKPGDGKRILLAMVALKTPAMPPTAALVDHLMAIPGVDPDLASVNIREGGISFNLGKDHAALALMPVPIPWANLEGPCATAWWWPEATETLKSHTSHIVVAVAGGSDHLIERNITLTHLTAAVALHTDAAGVYWGSGTLIHEPQAFIEQTQAISRENLPLPLWIDFRVEPNDDDSCRLFTTGMKAFGKMEIEIPHSNEKPADVFNFACCVADYILTKNPNIEDGQTIGRSASEKVRMARAPSMWNATITVLRLDL
jgi:hypothetical protein